MANARYWSQTVASRFICCLNLLITACSKGKRLSIATVRHHYSTFDILLNPLVFHIHLRTFHKKKQVTFACAGNQGCGSAFISYRTDPDLIRIQGFNDQKLDKITADKKLNFFGSKTTICLSLGLHKERPSYRFSSQKRTEEKRRIWIRIPVVRISVLQIRNSA